MKNRISFSLLVILTLVIISSPAWAIDRYVRADGVCGGNTPCYTDVYLAVADAVDGDIIYIYPGTYTWEADLSDMATPGDISLITVDASGNPDPGTATMTNTDVAPLSCTGGFSGNITINGLNLECTDAVGPDEAESGLYFVDVTGNITLTNVVATSDGWDGIALYNIDGNVDMTYCFGTGSYDDGIDINDCNGNITMTGCQATGNGDNGFHMDQVVGTVRFTECIGSSNRSDGFDIDDATGYGITGNLFMTDCIAQLNYNFLVGDYDEDGFDITIDGDLLMDGCSAIENNQEGLDISECTGSATIVDCLSQDNGGEGIDIDQIGVVIYITYSQVLNNGSIGITVAQDQFPRGDVIISCCDIADNDLAGMVLFQDIQINAENIWWGDASGPAPNGSGDIAADSSYGASGTIDYTPWLNAPFNRATCDVPEPEYPSDSQSIPMTNSEGMVLMLLLLTASAFWFIRKKQNI